jgi:hypothetical protein
MVGWPCSLEGGGKKYIQKFCGEISFKVNKMNLMKIDCEGGTWMEVAKDCVQWQFSVSGAEASGSTVSVLCC